MTHGAFKAHMPASLQKRINALPSVEKNGLSIVEGFGVFIDTHRDQPHVGTFSEDIHRGMCHPMLVDYIKDDDYLRSPTDGRLLQRHDKHLFITPESWHAFLTSWLMDHGEMPPEELPTSHFRDSRKGIYELKSFRQMIGYNESKP